MGERGLGYYKDVQQVGTTKDAKADQEQEQKAAGNVDQTEQQLPSLDMGQSKDGERRREQEESRDSREGEEKKEKSIPKLGFTNRIMFDLD
eukprot:748462-Hanusia_phi.AAC.1